MNKIKEAFKLTDKILDECSCDSNLTDVAFQKDTLFDDPERITKEKTDEETSLNPVPNTENVKSVLNKIIAEKVVQIMIPKDPQSSNVAGLIKSSRVPKSNTGPIYKDRKSTRIRSNLEGVMDIFKKDKKKSGDDIPEIMKKARANFQKNNPKQQQLDQIMKSMNG